MRLWMALLAVVPACGFHGPDPADDDGGGPMKDAQACYGTLSFDRVCFTVVPTMAVTMAASVQINTDDPSMCDQHNDQMAKYCVLAGAGFTLPMAISIRAFGSKPLVLISTTTMSIAGTVDVSSKHNTNPDPTNTGAAANPTGMCTGATAAMGNSGGFGGSFGGRGGDGEQKDTSTKPTAASALAVFPDRLRGGCAGGNGSTDTAGMTGGVAGSGGGAVAIVASTEIHLDGQINASGAGGHGGPMVKSGGGGGGSGGMIVLDASSITGTGLLFANGGSGAQGGAGNGAGTDGSESTGPTNTASGGSNTGTSGGDGGAGTSGIAKVDGSSPPNNAAGGGGGGAGGGGAGVIHAPGITTNIAPPSTNPS